MNIDPRLTEIDDALYRIATRAVVFKGSKVLLVKEKDVDWWSFPGGGVDYGESLHSAMLREVTEELGVPQNLIKVDDVIAFVTIGAVVNGVPRANIFYRVTVPENEIRPSEDVFGQKWFALDELQDIYISPGTDNVIEELKKLVS